MSYNGKNERIKRDYMRYLREARRQSVQSVDLAAKALDRFETYTKRRDFARFHIDQAMGFKRHLGECLNSRTGTRLSTSTQLQTLAALREFFIWLADQPGYRRTIRYSDAEYFSLPMKDAAAARREPQTKGPTLAQLRSVLAAMPSDGPINMRNRALLSCIVLTGARDNAVASLRLKHLDVSAQRLFQDSREVRTKASKSMTTSFFPVGDEFVKPLEAWVGWLLDEALWGPDDPLFPPSKVGVGEGKRFEAVGFSRQCWTTAGPVREIFKEACAKAGLPYFNPHSVRNTLARLGVEVCQTPHSLWVWSQNLGHEHLMTTLGSYAHLDEGAKAGTMGALWNAQHDSEEGKVTLRVSPTELAMLGPLLAAVRTGSSRQP